jgi:uroporphyrinogen-III synthase
VRRHQDRLAGDVAFARGRRAARLAKKRLATARSLQSPERAKEFHAEIGRALQGFLGDKLNVAEAGMIRESVAAGLTARGVSDDVVQDYVACLDACDRYRYAPAEVTAEDMRAVLARAERAMTTLDEALRR